MFYTSPVQNQKQNRTKASLYYSDALVGFC
jgi:hypothetical protein